MAVDYNSVVAPPPNGSTGPASFVLYFASKADMFPMWGVNAWQRDKMLRDFWPTEPMLASAMFSTVSKYTAFNFHLKGPLRQARIVRDRLHNSEHGNGWHVLNIKTLLDLFTQDNGAFQEVVRASDDPNSPCLALNHLDASRCYRTGQPDYPVIYTDINSRPHKLAWYQVLTIEEFPCPIEAYRNMQYCTVTRMLAAARYLRNVEIYEDEKVTGRYAKALHLVSGVSTKEIKEALGVTEEEAAQRGLNYFINAAVVGSINPEANVHAATLDFAGLPDGFDKEVTLKWFITQLALAFGADYQDFAPLPGGNLGSAHQAEVLHLKSRGKGPALYISLMGHKYNYHGIMPRTVHFAYGEQDSSQDQAQAQVELVRAQSRAARIASGEITPEIAALEAVDHGDMDPRYLDILGITDPTREVKIDASGD